MTTQKGISINVGDQVTYLTKEIKAENYHKSSTTKYYTEDHRHRDRRNVPADRSQ